MNSIVELEPLSGINPSPSAIRIVRINGKRYRCRRMSLRTWSDNRDFDWLEIEAFAWIGVDNIAWDSQPIKRRETLELIHSVLPRIIDSIPIKHPYFKTTCEHCGWTGSSELCKTISYGDDADVACAACRQIFLCNEVSA